MNKFSDNRFMKAVEQIAKNSVNNAIKNKAIAQAKYFGKAGIGLGALSGLGYTYFNKDEDNPATFSDYMKNMLIGSGIGGASGAGIGTLRALIPGYRSRDKRISNIVQYAKDNGRDWANSMEEENGYLFGLPRNINGNNEIANKIEDLLYAHHQKIKDRASALHEKVKPNSDLFDGVISDLKNYVPGTGKGEDNKFYTGTTLHDYLSRIDAYINSGILNKHEADIVRNYVKDIDPFDFTHSDLVNITKAIGNSQQARRDKAVGRLYNYLSNKATI